MQTISKHAPHAHRNLRTAAIVSLALVLPFMALEVINKTGFTKDFPIPLFAFLWLLALAVLLILMPLVRRLQAGDWTAANRFSLVARLGLAILLAGFWVALVLDQMPCFLGVPNCD